MISNITKGQGFKGVIEYVSNKQGAQLVATNCLQDEPRSVAFEMEATAEQYKNAKKVVFHASINPQDGDEIQNPRGLIEDYLEKMELSPDEHEYYAVRHNDTGREHYHVVVNRVSRDGESFWNDKNDFKKQQRACRELELEYGLKQTIKKGMTKQNKREMGEAKKHGLKEHPKETLRSKIRSAVNESRDIGSFEKKLSKQDINIHYSLNKEGKRRGISFTLGDSYKTNGIKKDYYGSSLGKEFSYNKITQAISKQQNKQLQTQKKASIGKSASNALGGVKASKKKQQQQQKHSGADAMDREEKKGQSRGRGMSM